MNKFDEPLPTLVLLNHLKHNIGETSPEDTERLTTLTNLLRELNILYSLEKKDSPIKLSFDTLKFNHIGNIGVVTDRNVPADEIWLCNGDITHKIINVQNSKI